MTGWWSSDLSMHECFPLCIHLNMAPDALTLLLEMNSSWMTGLIQLLPSINPPNSYQIQFSFLKLIYLIWFNQIGLWSFDIPRFPSWGPLPTLHFLLGNTLFHLCIFLYISSIKPFPDPPLHFPWSRGTFFLSQGSLPSSVIGLLCWHASCPRPDWKLSKGKTGICSSLLKMLCLK